MKQSEILQILDAILKTYSLNKRHSFDSCAMTLTLRDFLGSQPRYNRHVSTNKFVIKYANAKGRKFKCFHLVSENSGSLIPLSKSALSACFNKPTKKITRAGILSAMREAISYQIDQFRADQKQLREELIKSGFTELCKEIIKCPLTGKFLNSGCTHVDHKVEFIRLADAWLETQTSFKKFAEIPARTHYNTIVLQEDYLKSWQEFHQKYAMLQLASAKANVKKGSRGYRSSH